MNLIVYHIYCVNEYLPLVKEQVSRLIDSGLYDWCDALEVTCVDETNNFEGIDEVFKELKKVNLFKTNINRFEYYPLKKIWDYSQTYEGKVFYFHSKGVSNKYKIHNQKEVSDWKVNGIRWWKEIMEYFLIDNWKDCIEKLETNDNCGVTNVSNWYWGNFWWSNLSYVKENPKPIGAGRWYYEDWLNYQREYKYHEFWHFEFNPYFSDLPDDIYKTDNWYSDKKNIEVLSAFYGSIDIQQDEGCPIIDEPILIDVTNKVSERLTDTGLFVRSDNELCGDPHFGVSKYMIVNLKVDQYDLRYVVNEGKNLIINFQ